jgi:hypothetical protein
MAMPLVLVKNFSRCVRQRHPAHHQLYAEQLALLAVCDTDHGATPVMRPNLTAPHRYLS